MSDRSTWMQASLSDLYEFKNGVNADRQAYGRGIPFINVLEPITYSHLKGHEISGRVELPGAAVAAYEVRQGDLVFNRTSEVGDEVGLAATYLGTECVVFGGFVIRARPVSKLIDSSFAAYAMRAPDVRTQIIAMGQGAVRANIGQENLRRVELKFPPLPEQLAIATALADADALIDSLEQLLTKKRQIKQGAMQELLTGKRRLPGFTGKWATASLGQIAKVKTGSMNNQDKVEDGEYPFFVRSQSVERIDIFTHDCDAILVPGEGGIGSIFHYIEGRFALHQRVYGVTDFSDAVVGRFLYFYMRVFFGAHAMENSVKATVDSLRLPTFLDFEVRLPPTKNEQTAIVEVLSDVEREVESLELRLTKARTLKQAMAQALLTGRIRLVEPTA